MSSVKMIENIRVQGVVELKAFASGGGRDRPAKTKALIANVFLVVVRGLGSFILSDLLKTKTVGFYSTTLSCQNKIDVSMTGWNLYFLEYGQMSFGAHS